jgi:hypothetical protein
MGTQEVFKTQIESNFPIPLNPPLSVKNSIPMHDKSQRGKNPEQNWIFTRKLLKENRNKLPFNKSNLPFNKWLFFNWF